MLMLWQRLRTGSCGDVYSSHGSLDFGIGLGPFHSFDFVLHVTLDIGHDEVASFGAAHDHVGGRTVGLCETGNGLSFTRMHTVVSLLFTVIHTPYRRTARRYKIHEPAAQSVDMILAPSRHRDNEDTRESYPSRVIRPREKQAFSVQFSHRRWLRLIGTACLALDDQTPPRRRMRLNNLLQG